MVKINISDAIYGTKTVENNQQNTLIHIFK